MRYLLDRLHTELLTLLPYPNSDSPFIGPKGKSTIVTAIFGGLLQNEVNCLVCGVESKKHDPFLGNLKSEIVNTMVHHIIIHIEHSTKVNSECIALNRFKVNASWLLKSTLTM